MTVEKIDHKNGLVLEFLDYMNSPTEHAEWEKRCEGEAPNVRCAYEDFYQRELRKPNMLVSDADAQRRG